jgi:hypothetical protein
MSYDDECPANWSSYDRVATAAADMRFLMFEMQAGVHVLGPLVFARRIGDTKPSREDLRAAMGPLNYERAREYLDCVAGNVKKMGSIALAFAATVMAQSTDPSAAPVLDRVRARMSEDNINGAWNLVEAWVCGRALPPDDDDDEKPDDAPAVLP